MGNPRALCAPFLAALCAATRDEPDWAERLLAAEFSGEAPGRPIYGVVHDDGDPADQRMRVKVGARGPNASRLANRPRLPRAYRELPLGRLETNIAVGELEPSVPTARPERGASSRARPPRQGRPRASEACS